MKLQRNQLPIFDQFLDAVFVINKDGVVEYTNETGAFLFNRSISRIVNKKSILELARFEPELRLTSSLDDGNNFQPYREYIIRVDGQLKYVNLAVELLELDGSLGSLLLIRDVTLEKSLHEKYHKELYEKNKVLELEMQQRVSLQLLTTELDRKVFEISCLLEFTQRTRLISDANHLFNEFIDFMIERYYLGGGFIIKENFITNRVEIHTIKGKAKRRLALNSFRELNVLSQKFAGKLNFEEVEYLKPPSEDWRNLVNHVFTDDCSGMIICPLKQHENFRGAIVVAHSSAHHGLNAEDLNLTRSLLQHVNVLLENTSLKHLSITDELTGLYNKRYLKMCLTHELSKSVSGDMPLTALVFDIDFFKKFNDTYGHLIGDHVLTSVGQAIKNLCRVSDLAFRYGGEEFVVLLPNTNLEDALICAERVRSGIEKMEVNIDGKGLKITVSIGISGCPELTKDSEELIKTADIALYAAKQDGRNNVKTYSPNMQFLKASSS